MTVVFDVESSIYALSSLLGGFFLLDYFILDSVFTDAIASRIQKNVNSDLIVRIEDLEEQVEKLSNENKPK
jgi:hypothetical protein